MEMKALILILVFSAAVSAQLAEGSRDSCTSGTQLDPVDKARGGGDYRGVMLPNATDASGCIAACCGDARCRSFSWNDPQPSNYMGCTKGGKCCLLKDTVPPLGSNKWGPAVRTGVAAKPPPPRPVPTPIQQQYMDRGLTQFMHFSVTTFGNIEHDCVDGKCLPPSLFNPTNLSTDQWVETAVGWGAKEICLTAHHEGGFALWPSAFSNYSVMASPFARDIVAPFVASCRKYGVDPCFYIGPNANGYFTQVLRLTPDEFIARQRGMITEVLTKYGFISRLWWDHYQQGCGGLSECPGGFPQGWDNFTLLVRKLSPKTIIGTGPDVGHSKGGESGVGSYPIWNMCDTHGGDPMQTCASFSPTGSVFRPREADATIQNPGDAWFWKKNHAYWNASQLWDHVMLTWGRGDMFILNMPPDTTGQIPQKYVDETNKFGAAMRATFDHAVAASTAGVTANCSDARVELQLPAGASFDTVMSREDMTELGQRIASYAVQAKIGGQWKDVGAAYGGIHGETVGNRVVDFVGAAVDGASAVAWQCLSAAEEPVALRSFGVYTSQRPA